MRLSLPLLALLGCGTPPAARDAAPATPRRPLGMNDVTILVPLPADRAAPVLAAIDGGPGGVPLVARGHHAALVEVGGDLAPKSGDAVAYGDYHVVGVRFDLCDREEVGPCPAGADGRLRLVLQPLYAGGGGAVLAHDLAVHAFYPIAAAELPEVVAELRAMAQLHDTPTAAPLGVSPAIAASPAYTARLAALVSRFARWDHLVRLTVIGQAARSAAFAWVMRGVDVRANTLSRMVIPNIGATEQFVLVAGGDAVYNTDPVADVPAGFALALNGQLFAGATPAEQRAAVEALVEIEHPLRHDAVDLQCVACHVATPLLERRAARAGVDLATVAGRYETPYDTRVDTIAGRDPRVVRALGWATGMPAISRRVAHDTAQVLTELEHRFPDP